MQNPFTHHPAEAFQIAETSTAAALSAVLFFRPLRPRVATVMFFVAIWWVALLPDSFDLLNGLDFKLDPATVYTHGLRIAAALASAAMLLARPGSIAGLAILGEGVLYRTVDLVQESSWELCALHLLWLGLLLGADQLRAEREEPPRVAPPRSARPWREHRAQDAVLAWAAIGVGALTSVMVLFRGCDSADEWAYTYQAAVFAKLHAYGLEPACSAAFRSFWVFGTEGRLFSQYTPGWPLFMTPFVMAHVAWLAGPFSLGVLCVGIARLARRAADGAFGGRPDLVAAAGPVAVVTTLLANTVEINGGSRFSHLFVGACFAWSVEALAIVATPGVDQESQWRWGATLGAMAAWMLATRPADGGALGVGLLLYSLYALALMRAGWRAVAAAALGFAVWGGFMLVILRLQLGKWFTTGYSLTDSYYPWAKFGWSIPKARELKWGVPLATGAYCWWPLAPALGVGGLFASMRAGGRRVVFMLVTSTLGLFALYSILEYGRGGTDFGYGPRYVLPAVVPMAVGTAVLIAPLWIAARAHIHARPALSTGGPMLLAMAAALCGVVRIAPLVFPMNHEDLRLRNQVFVEAKAEHLKNAIVWLVPHTTISDPMDLTQNYPLELYPNPDVIIAIDRGPDVKKCVQELYPKRHAFHTDGRDNVRLVPE